MLVLNAWDKQILILLLTQFKTCTNQSSAILRSNSSTVL